MRFEGSDSNNETQGGTRTISFHEMSEEQMRKTHMAIVLWMFLGGFIVIAGLLFPRAHWTLAVIRYILIILGFFIAVPPIFQLNGLEQEFARREARRLQSSNE